MKFNNQEIYSLATVLQDLFKESNIYIPVKANFKLQKNINNLSAAAQEIETSRANIIKQYGTPNKDGKTYTIPEANLKAANKELIDLFSIEQELDIKTCSIDDFGDIQFTAAQMQAIMFMIED